MDIILDIETLSTSINALILTIGAIKFKRTEKLKELKDMETLYIRIDIKSCQKLQMDVDTNTEIWWNNQSEEARFEALKNPDRVPLKDGLIQLSNFVKNSRCIWANSPSFDCIILENAYNLCNLKVPWDFWNLRDCRTLYDIGKVNLNKISEVEHNALSDCYRQLKGVYISFENLKL
jgi:hypothetical protein